MGAVLPARWFLTHRLAALVVLVLLAGLLTASTARAEVDILAGTQGNYTVVLTDENDAVQLAGGTTGPGGTQQIEVTGTHVQNLNTPCTLDILGGGYVCTVTSLAVQGEAGNQSVTASDMQVSDMTVELGGDGTDTLTGTGAWTTPLTVSSTSGQTGGDTIDLTGLTNGIGQALTVGPDPGPDTIDLSGLSAPIVGPVTITAGARAGNSVDLGGDTVAPSGQVGVTMGNGADDAIGVTGLAVGTSGVVALSEGNGANDVVGAGQVTVGASGRFGITTGGGNSDTVNATQMSVGNFGAAAIATGGGAADSVQAADADVASLAQLGLSTGLGNADTIDLTDATIELAGILSAAVGNGTGDSIAAPGATLDQSSSTTISAGNGNDTIDLSSATVIPSASVGITTGSGNSDVELNTSQAGVTAMLGTGTNTLDLSSDPAGDTFTYTSPTDIASGDGASFDGVSSFDATAGNDTILGTSGSQTINGEGGNNFISGGGGADFLNGGTGTNNTLSYAFEPASVPVTINLTTHFATATENGAPENSTVIGFQNADGGDGPDDIVGTTGPNVLMGGASNDTIEGFGGNDTLDGGGGSNTVSYGFESPSDPVTIDLTAGSATATGDGTSSLANFQNATGGQGNDTLIGTTGPNVLSGGPGNDTIRGEGGGDTIDGGEPGVNKVDYTDQPAGSSVTINLAQGTAMTPDGDQDTLTNIQGVIGGPANDTVVMPSSGQASVDLGTGFNTLDFSAVPSGTTFTFPTATTLSALGGTFTGIDGVIGTAGNDVFNAAGTADTLNGGGGTNTLSYAGYTGATQSVTVDLVAGTAVTQDGTSSISRFQNVTGGAGADTLTGDSGANVLFGGPGADLISGGGGADELDGGAGNDLIDGSGGASTIVGGGGDDTVTFASQTAPVTVDLTGAPDSGVAGQNEVIEGVENAIGGSGNDTIVGSSGEQELQGGGGNDTIIPGLGSDTIDGGSGSNTVSFADRAANDPVTIDLATNSATEGDFTDRLISIGAAIGGAGPDTLIAGPGTATLDGGPGDDTIIGGSGPDSIDAGAGNDFVQAGTGGDTITTDGGADVVEARQSVADAITCGGSADLVVADAIDTVNSCPNVELPAPVLGGATGPSYPTQPTGPAVTTITYPSITAFLVSKFAPARKGYTRVRQLELKTVGVNTDVVATCTSSAFKVCPFRQTIKVLAKQTPLYSLDGLFGDVPLPPKTQLTIQLIQPGSITRTYAFVLRKGSQPKQTVTCTPPGQKAGTCAA